MLLKAAEDSVQVPEPMLRRIDRLTGCGLLFFFRSDISHTSTDYRTWIASCKEVQTIGSRPYVKRLINHDNDAQAITSQLSVITWAIQSFMVGALRSISSLAVANESYQVESLLAIEFALDVRPSSGFRSLY
jgi:hypothetical protein